jgi:hypothetical protein
MASAVALFPNCVAYKFSRASVPAGATQALRRVAFDTYPNFSTAFTLAGNSYPPKPKP